MRCSCAAPFVYEKGVLKQLSGAGYVIKLKQRQADDEEHANDFLTHNLNPKLFENIKYNYSYYYY